MIGVAAVRDRARASLQRHLGSWAAALLDEPGVAPAARDEGVDTGPTASAPSSPVEPETNSLMGTTGASTATTAGAFDGLTQPPKNLLTVALGPPSEREMLSDQRAAEAWAGEWTAFSEPDGVTVEWTTRSWRSIGRQRVPVRVRVRDADAVADLAGGQARREWLLLTARVRLLDERLGHPSGLGTVVKRHCARLVGYDEREFEQVVAVAAWVLAHPVTGFRPRQVPVRGVDSKWLGRHRSVVRDLVAAATDTPELGLIEADPLVRLRILDPALARGGPTDFAAPPEQVASLDLAPPAVLVVENLESVLAMAPIPGGVVVHGGGFAVDVVATLPWVRRVPVLYWGDLDSHGFAILHRLRSGHPAVTSVLMDEETLTAHRNLWVPEPSPTRGTFPTLTDDEQAALDRLRVEDGIRLEQERIPWDVAFTAILTAWNRLTSG